MENKTIINNATLTQCDNLRRLAHMQDSSKVSSAAEAFAAFIHAAEKDLSATDSKALSEVFGRYQRKKVSELLNGKSA